MFICVGERTSRKGFCCGNTHDRVVVLFSVVNPEQREHQEHNHGKTIPYWFSERGQKMWNFYEKEIGVWVIVMYT